jgi:glycosyltransferase involved in cell wall biosynthesis
LHNVGVVKTRQLLRSLLGVIPSLLPKKSGISFLVEKKSWSIREDGIQISRIINDYFDTEFVKVSSQPFFNNREIVHFGSQFMFENWFSSMLSVDKVVVTYFHGKYGDSAEIDRNLTFLIRNQEKVRTVVTSNSLMRDRLLGLGVTEPNLVVVPIGVNLELFTLQDEWNREHVRKSLGIPSNFFVIGSFQKDGVGWGKGLEPKLIKGPDILVETARQISLHTPTFVLLSGPSRGYVLRELSRLGIPYKHLEVEHAYQVASLYQAIDAYVISSREEGGPKGLLEALASGTPVASTPVGMVHDLASFSHFLQVTNDFQPHSLVDSLMAIRSQSMEMSDRTQLRELVRHCDWARVGHSHWKHVYEPLMSDGNRS